jgi:hypothetical protein
MNGRQRAILRRRDHTWPLRRVLPFGEESQGWEVVAFQIGLASGHPLAMTGLLRTHWLRMGRREENQKFNNSTSNLQGVGASLEELLRT